MSASCTPAIGDTKWFVERDDDAPKGMRFRVAQARFERWLDEGDAPRWYRVMDGRASYFGSKKEAAAACLALNEAGATSPVPPGPLSV